MVKRKKIDNLLEFWNDVIKSYLYANQNSIKELKLKAVEQHINIFDLSKDYRKDIFRSLSHLHHYHSHPDSEFRFGTIAKKVNDSAEILISDNIIDKGLENLIDLGLVIKKDNGKYIINPEIRTIENRDLYESIKDIAFQ